MRVLIADDLAWMRSSLQLLLEEEFNVEIVGEISETGALLPAIQHLAPDVVLLDWALPGLHSLETRQHLIAALRGMNSCVCLVVLRSSLEDYLPARVAGVDAWVSKAEPPQRLLEALHGLWPTQHG